MVQDEVQQEVEALVKEKSNRFAALEWVGVQKGKMEVVVRDKVVAEALVEQLSSTRCLLWLPPLISCPHTPTALLLNAQSQSLLRRRGSLASTWPSPQLKIVLQENQLGKPYTRGFEWRIDEREESYRKNWRRQTQTAHA